MYKKMVGMLYVMNIVFQSFFTLLTPVGVCFLISWLLVRYASFPGWTYAPLLVLGVISGFYSMIKFVLTAMAGYERLEAEQNGRVKRYADSRRADTDKIEYKGNNNEEK